jgi:hypothetical protein
MGIRLCLALVAGLTVTALLVPATQGATAPQRYAAGLVPSRLGSPDPRDTAALDAIPAAAFNGNVKVTVAGTNDSPVEVTNGGITGTGTFAITGAITDKGAVSGYRTVKGDPTSLAGALITLRFVTTGKQGEITYVVTIDTKAGTSLWTIASATGAYRGLKGNGTESEDAGFTVSTLTGTVSS